MNEITQANATAQTALGWRNGFGVTSAWVTSAWVTPAWVISADSLMAGSSNKWRDIGLAGLIAEGWHRRQ